VSSDGGTALQTPSTPQNMAFNWLAANNTDLGTYANEKIIQRYALATLYFSTNGESWDTNAFWLDNGEECGKWQDYSDDGTVSCTDAGAVIHLDFTGNNVNGALPPEIGLLSSIRKFVIEERMTLYFARTPNCVAMFHLVIDLMLSCCFINFSTEYLWLCGNALTGTVPTEVGQLTELGEYTRDCCHDALAQSLWVSIHSYPSNVSNGLFCLLCSIFWSLPHCFDWDHPI
jgi:hypothetical protein